MTDVAETFETQRDRLFSLRENTERGEPDIVIGNHEFHAGRLPASRASL